MKSRRAGIPSSIVDPRRVHLPRQPLAAVNAQVQIEGEPTGQPCVHEAEGRVDEVVVVVQALAAGGHQPQHLRVTVAADVIRPEYFHGAEHADQPFPHAVPRGNLAGRVFLADRRTGQVPQRPSGGTGQGRRGVTDLLGDALHILFEVLQQHADVVQERGHPRGVGHQPQRPPEPHPIKPAKRPRDRTAVAL